LTTIIKPLGFDWRIGIGLITSFAAREVMVSTMATVLQSGAGRRRQHTLRQRLRAATDPETAPPAPR
jgi:ferrous iron transport protein B